MSILAVQGRRGFKKSKSFKEKLTGISRRVRIRLKPKTSMGGMEILMGKNAVQDPPCLPPPPLS